MLWHNYILKQHIPVFIDNAIKWFETFMHWKETELIELIYFVQFIIDMYYIGGVAKYSDFPTAFLGPNIVINALFFPNFMEENSQ